MTCCECKAPVTMNNGAIDDAGWLCPACARENQRARLAAELNRETIERLTKVKPLDDEKGSGE